MTRPDLETFIRHWSGSGTLNDVSTHLVRRGIVLEDMRLCFVPVQKAGFTSFMWSLAELAGLDETSFSQSVTLQVSRAMAVHDLRLWGQRYRLRDRTETEIEEILTSDKWFRFAVVREPIRRLWSAWASMVLPRDPALYRRFHGTEWFPRVPWSSDEVTEDFRMFLGALAGSSTESPQDPHWALQSRLIWHDTVTYGHIGRVESLHSTLEAVNEHLKQFGRRLPDLRRENQTLLPFSSDLFDRDGAEAANRWTQKDREDFGYPAIVGGLGDPDQHWQREVELKLPLLRAVLDRNERIADLYQTFTEVASPRSAPPWRLGGVAKRLGLRSKNRLGSETATPAVDTS